MCLPVVPVRAFNQKRGRHKACPYIYGVYDFGGRFSEKSLCGILCPGVAHWGVMRGAPLER